MQQRLSHHLRVLVLALGVVCLLRPVGAATDTKDTLIREIAFSGFEHVPDTVPAMVQDAVKCSKIYRHYSQEAIALDKKAILDLGWFKQVDTRTIPLNDGIRLEFLVAKNPIVDEVAFEGNTIFSSAQLSLAISTRPHQVVNTKVDCATINDLYHQLGYLLASVINVKFANGNVTYVVWEPTIGAVTISGNRKISTESIQQQLLLKPGDFYNTKLVEQSLAAIREKFAMQDVTFSIEPTQESTISLNIKVVE